MHKPNRSGSALRRPRRIREVSSSWPALLAAALAAGSSAAAASPADFSSPRERLSFNADWRFIKGDPPGAQARLSYQNLRPWLTTMGAELTANLTASPPPESNPGNDVAYTQPNYTDSEWRRLNLPHDWGVEGPFKQEYPGETGKLPWWGVAWYRKQFTLPASDVGLQLTLEVDGAMSYASVWLNGQFVGGWPYGYSSWHVDLTRHAKPGARNVLAIRLENPPESSRWYPGGGIYRNVWLVKTAPIHIAHWGVRISTPAITSSGAEVKADVRIENASVERVEVEVTASIYELDAKGKPGPRPVAGTPQVSCALAGGACESTTLSAKVSEPKLWDLKRPNRYAAVTSVLRGGKLVDRCVTPFGIRTIQFTADNGFLLNGV